MIGKLKGIVDEYGEDHVILDVGGVGYEIFCSGLTLQALPRPGEPAVLLVETHVREDQIRLYGFASAAERDWFRLLQNVQGVGARLALGVLSVLRPADLATAIAFKDIATLSRAPGVGRKLAERIAVELKDKGPALTAPDPALVRLQAEVADRRLAGPEADAVSALVNLGYPQVRASAAVAAAVARAGETPTTERLIRLALRELAGG